MNIEKLTTTMPIKEQTVRVTNNSVAEKSPVWAKKDAWKRENGTDTDDDDLKSVNPSKIRSSGKKKTSKKARTKSTRPIGVVQPQARDHNSKSPEAILDEIKKAEDNHLEIKLSMNERRKSSKFCLFIGFSTKVH